MAPAPPLDEKRLQAYYATNGKYVPDPVPTPLDRAAAIDFVNARVNTTLAPGQVRKLVRLAVFYDLRETAPAFAAVLQSSETQPEDFFRSALCLIALAWIGDAGQQAGAQRYFHALQQRADIDMHRGIMLEVVEAFGAREGTGAHRQWVSGAIVALEGRLRQEQAKGNIPGIKLMQEKIKALTEYLNIQLPLVERAFSLRQRIDAMSPPERQILPLVSYSLGALAGSSPALSYWASMRLLRIDAALRPQAGIEFYAAGGAQAKDDQIRARALRAAAYFGHPLTEADVQWLAGHPDPLTDPLVLRPRLYVDNAPPTVPSP